MKNALTVGLATGLCWIAACADIEGEGDVEVGAVEEAIINGSESVPHDQPWIVRIQGRDGFCAGAIIHPSYVVTSAQCLRFTIGTVTAGEHKVSLNEGTEQKREIDFVDGDPSGEVWVAQLDSPLEINENVQTIALPDATNSRTVPSSLLVAGWGQTRVGANTISDVLRQARVSLLPNANCGSGSKQICADGRTLAGHVGPCGGDVGDPLMNDSTTERRQLIGLGLNKFGDSCAGPDIYTRVSSYAAWIQQSVGSWNKLRGNYRITRNAGGQRALHGRMTLRCAATRETRTGPLDVDGVEVALDCPASSSVTATCTVDAGYFVNLANMRRRLNEKGAWSDVGASNSVTRTNTYGTTNATDIVEWSCGVGD